MICVSSTLPGPITYQQSLGTNVPFQIPRNGDHTAFLRVWRPSPKQKNHVKASVGYLLSESNSTAVFPSDSHPTCREATRTSTPQLPIWTAEVEFEGFSSLRYTCPSEPYSLGTGWLEVRDVAMPLNSSDAVWRPCGILKGAGSTGDTSGHPVFVAKQHLALVMKTTRKAPRFRCLFVEDAMDEVEAPAQILRDLT
ncbi:hypothetical protein CC80DRAFT_571171 [Byssothecium circinans]|uniref:Uncharacterized protein n=1 Tax=Byssothecium circinans TaxID=147558 RepID=A0A6A5TJ33_9PLEO|nr:hypothetical protein CC80DRAFT_571171 [Byssothecium circinans]